MMGMMDSIDRNMDIITMVTERHQVVRLVYRNSVRRVGAKLRGLEVRLVPSKEDLLGV